MTSSDVTFSGDAPFRVIKLHLGGYQLTSLPAEIGQLRSLERLDLNANYLTSLPAEIGQLRSLKELDLGDIEHLYGA